MAERGSDGLVPGFPADFGWGVSTSSYQIEGAVNEGGRGQSIWDTFSHEPGRTANGETGDVACDHYHRFEEDLDLMADLGVSIYRFSIAWPRVMPTGKGPLNEKGVDFYSRLVDGLLQRGIEPFPTLYHWDLPQTLEDEGGWPKRDTAKRFGEYAAAMYERLGDRVELWLTHNEPWVTSFMAYVGNEKAPGVYNDWPRALRVSHHLLLSHGLAVQALRAVRPSARIGMAPNLAPTVPASDRTEDVEAAQTWDGFQNRWFLDPVLKGTYPEDMLARYERFDFEESIEDGDLATIAAPIDLLGINFYHRAVIEHDPGSVYLEMSGIQLQSSLTEMGWEITPEALRRLLVRIRDDYGDVDIYITENGCAYPDRWDGGEIVDDPDRVEFISRHVEQLSLAIADGVPMKGYCVWSLIDNYEWEKGYAKRFGLYYVDYPTQRRIPKRSALWYRDQIAASRAGSA
jgi:beta-glucosidase